jgi:hypothetical protein
MLLILMSCQTPETEPASETPENIEAVATVTEDANAQKPPTENQKPLPPMANTLSAATHCEPEEGVVFNCATTAGSKGNPKIVSLCAHLDGSENDWVQYRFGAKGNVELTFPTEKKDAFDVFTVEETRTIRSDGMSVHFNTDAARFSVSSRTGSSHPGEAEYNNFEGVELQVNNGQYVAIRCDERPEDHLSLMTHWLKAE